MPAAGVKHLVRFIVMFNYQIVSSDIPALKEKSGDNLYSSKGLYTRGTRQIEDTKMQNKPPRIFCIKAIHSGSDVNCVRE